MEINVIEEKKNKFEFEITDVSHEFCLALKDELYKNKDASIITYRMDHPLIRTAVFHVETKSKSPRELIKNAVKELTKENSKIITKLGNL